MDEIQKHLFVLILAGGGGTRLWPKSREAFPKQFLKLFHGKSLFRLALDRSLRLTTPDKIYISTSDKYFSLVKKEAGKVPAENIIREPMRRDTALAEGVGATYIYNRDPQAVICNFPSDHLISPVSTFETQMKELVRLAFETELFATIGIKPTYPHTGMGYIKTTPSKYSTTKLGEHFIEKPSLVKAKRYLRGRDYYWNAHLFTWKAKTFLNLLKKHAPKTYSLLPKLEQAIGTDKEKQVLQLVYQMAPSISTDFAVAEQLRKFLVMPAKFDWSDVGDWSEIWKHLPHDSQGNVIMGKNGNGKLIGLNSKNNLLILDKKLVTLVGLQDMIIVDTPDAILIGPKENAQHVKAIVQQLKDQNLSEFL